MHFYQQRRIMGIIEKLAEFPNILTLTSTSIKVEIPLSRNFHVMQSFKKREPHTLSFCFVFVPFLFKKKKKEEEAPHALKIPKKMENGNFFFFFLHNKRLLLPPLFPF
jgi:hypothetical protein